MKPRMAIVQPEVPHYREEFFLHLSKKCKAMDIYVYNSFEDTRKHGFNISTEGFKYIRNLNVHEVLLYNPLPLCSKRYDTLVLMLHFAHITTWLLLLTKWLHHKKIILWGQGISVKRYMKESQKPDWRLKWMIALSDGTWLYQEPEARQWQEIFPNKTIVALHNTLTGVDEMCQDTFDDEGEKTLKRKLGIHQEMVLIFCARFDNDYRRPDLLVEAIERLDSGKFSFIIIGDGKNKPDFSRFPNVHDYGAIYDKEKKCELFAVADAYFQPGWVGLSIVEAMAYGKPVLTFKRSEQTLQCVEYCYIEDGKNGLLFDDMNDCLHKIAAITKEEMRQMGKQAQRMVEQRLTPRLMAERAMSIV